MKMTCPNCGQDGAYIRRSTIAFGDGDELLVVENVPLVTCRECGMDLYSAVTLHQIERLEAHLADLPHRSIPFATFQDEEDPALAELAEVAA
jgi:YgiT-type zinc finger domain-containing protein